MELVHSRLTSVHIAASSRKTMGKSTICAIESRVNSVLPDPACKNSRS